MCGQRWVIGAVLAIVAANTGCVSCSHKTYHEALTHAADCDLPTPCRSRVYVFMVNGLTPTTGCGLTALRDKLAESGFAKVGTADIAAGLWLAGEVKKIRACEPDARIVLLGYDLGGGAAVCVARDLAAKGIPVDAVVLLDPLACGGPCGLRTLVINSGKRTSCSVPNSDWVAVPDASHHKLPAHPTTVAAITALLQDIAARGYEPAGDPVPEWGYKHAPEMRPVVAGKWSDEWDFLADQPGITRAIGTRAVTRPVPPVPVSTSAGPVVLKR